MSLARIRRTRLDQLVDEGSKTAVLARIALNDLDRFIAACQLGITLSTLALGAVGIKFFAVDMHSTLQSAGIYSQQMPLGEPAVLAFCYVLAFSVTAFMQIVFGEIIPKTLTFPRSEPVLLMLIRPLEAWCAVTSPFLQILNGSTAFFLRLLNIKEEPRRHYVHSEEELKILVSASHEEGIIEEEEEELLHSVFDFADTVAHEVMTPRTDMICLPADSTVREFVDTALKHGHSRIPVYEEDIDSIFGAVHIRNGLRAIINGKQDSQIRQIARKVLIVPENKDAGDLLKEFKVNKTHMAIVVDEYGGTRGLVTIEDLVEELVGDIADEHEIVKSFIVEQPDGSILVNAGIDLDEFNDELEMDLEDEQFNTLGGHVFGLLGREPQVGDEVQKEGYLLRVEEADRHRITQLRLIRTEGPEEESDQKEESVDEVSESSDKHRILNGHSNGNAVKVQGKLNHQTEA